jgi:DNA repair exonuclease SbcCD ATPase subunit
MQLPLASRREIIEDLLDIQVFSIMNTNLKERMKRLADDIRLTENNIDLAKHKIETQGNLIVELENKSDSIVLDKSNKIDEFSKQSNFLLEENQDLNVYITEKQCLLDNQDKISNKFDNLKEIKFKFKNKVSNLIKENKFYNENDNCPTCKQILDESFKLEKIAKNSSTLKETENAWTELETEMQKVGEQLDNFRTINSDIQTRYSQIDKNNSMINHLQRQITQLEKEIDDVQDQKNTSNKEKEVLEKLNSQLVAYEEILIAHKQNKDYYSLCSNLLKDTGIKTKIIKRYLPVMNKLINQFLQQMDFFVNFTLSESFEETIKSRYRDDFSYPSFSEGEKSRIDIALMLTWRSVAKLKNSVDTNLLILDEIFDSSLDNTGTDELSFILRNFTNDVNLFIISHREHMVDKFDRVLKFNKVKNFSKMEELTNAMEV